MIKKNHKRSERGQAIIIIAAAFVGMVAMVGLMTDGGMLLVEYARLKRGIDSASIAAAAQFRKDFVTADLETAAREFLALNQSDVDSISIDTCLATETEATDPLCALPKRKLVKVIATRHITFGFLKVVGINGTDITASSVGEAASIDMVLVIDTSASMAFETTGDTIDPNYATNCVVTAPDYNPVSCVHPLRSDRPSQQHPHGDDPEYCNANDNDINLRCEPLGKIKDVAANFVDKLFFPYDRVSVVALTEQQIDGTATRTTDEVIPLTDYQPTVVAALQGLKVFQPTRCTPSDGSVCLNFTDLEDDVPDQGLVYLGLESKLKRDTGDPSLLTSSDIGGGLFMAGNEFVQPPMRQDSYWVVIALIGGPANATTRGGSFPPNGFCPDSDWGVPYCRDIDPLAPTPATRHLLHGGTDPLPADPLYDADDFARDGADFVTDPVNGQGATIFSICVGSYCQNYPTADPASAEHLGQYMALTAGGTTANHGLYFYSADPAGLQSVFDAIAAKIFTRISQ